MGWFFNKDNSHQNNSTQQQINNNQQSTFKSNSSFYSKKRRCQNDPEDDQFMICKTVIKDNNGTREEEERLPKSGYIGTSMNEESTFSYNSAFGGGDNVQEGESEKAFDKFMSFLIQPSFLDFHNSAQATPQGQNHSGQQIESYSSKYSQSRTCHTDPQDNQYLICKSKVFDGKQTKEIEERVKASEQFLLPSMREQFGNVGHEIDREIHNLMRDINKGFNLVVPFIGPVMGFINELQNLDQSQGISNNVHIPGYFPKDHKQAKRNDDGSRSKYFTSTNNKKDTNIYDL